MKQEQDTLERWKGKPVTVNTFNGAIYYAKISEYDADFITLNPFIEDNLSSFVTTQRKANEALDKYEAGKSNLEILISRKNVKSIEKFEKKDYIKY